MQRPEPCGTDLADVEAFALCGVDFSSAPSRRKPIRIAEGVLRGLSQSKTPTISDGPGALSRAGGCTLKGPEDCNPRRPEIRPQLHWRALKACANWESFEHFLRLPGPRLAAFDLPFGLPRGLLRAWNWEDLDYRAISERFAHGDRAMWIAQLKAFCASRPEGSKFAHRACDLPVGSSPSMKWVNPPVVFMYREGFSRILQAGWLLPGFDAIGMASASQQEARLAVEAYPGALARALVGRASYKADDAKRQNGERREIRGRIIEGIEGLGPRFGLELSFDAAMRQALLDDARGDALDALLCLVIAARCALNGPPRWGAPEDCDPLEGWIAV